MSTNSNNKRCNIYFCEIKSKMGFMNTLYEMVLELQEKHL